jgi:hypothetical protein
VAFELERLFGLGWIGGKISPVKKCELNGCRHHACCHHICDSQENGLIYLSRKTCEFANTDKCIAVGCIGGTLAAAIEKLKFIAMDS